MVRTFTIEDLDVVMKIWLETNIQSHDFIDKGYWQGNYKMVKEMLPDSTIFVYGHNNTIHGFIGLTGNYIAGIFVAANSQSGGRGKALLDYVKKKCSELSLHVYKKNHRALKFYLREDFVVSREQVDKNTGEVELVLNWTK